MISQLSLAVIQMAEQVVNCKYVQVIWGFNGLVSKNNHWMEDIWNGLTVFQWYKDGKDALLNNFKLWHHLFYKPTINAKRKLWRLTKKGKWNIPSKVLDTETLVTCSAQVELENQVVVENSLIFEYTWPENAKHVFPSDRLLVSHLL